MSVSQSATYVCHTLYHVYISILKVIDAGENAEVVLVDTIPEVNTLAERLEREAIFSSIHVVERGKQFLNVRSYHVNHIYCVLHRKKLVGQLSCLLGAHSLRLFNDYTEIGAFLNLNGIGYHLLEDGCNCFKVTNQYEPHGKARGVKKFLRDRFDVPLGIGWGKYIIDIEVNDAANLRTPLKHPVVEAPRDKLMDAPDGAEIRKLFRVFGADFLYGVPEHSAVILTEPLWQMGVVRNADDNVDFYGDLADSIGGNCYVKPHPRDVGDYTRRFPQDRIIEKNAPVELLNYLGENRIDLAITYSSTSLHSLKSFKRKIILNADSADVGIEHVALEDVLNGALHAEMGKRSGCHSTSEMPVGLCL